MNPSSDISPEDLKYFKEAFALLDLSDDGHVTIQELATFMRTLGHEPADADLQALINEVNMDGSGAINFEEFLTMMQRKMKKPFQDEELRAAFRVFDKANTGYIDKHSIAEVFIAVGEHPNSDEMDELIREGDFDGDGKLSFEEFVHLMSQK
ncbi:calmodulin-like [Drosophila tropicalis]|uniref:calmodulin-like n=1 Tax=Drosophila tropicalis TaxID=46794 RepID=UPI0035AC292A